MKTFENKLKNICLYQRKEFFCCALKMICANDTKQCAAPENGKRCTRRTADTTKLHCVKHFKKAQQLYDVYHNICEQLEKYNIEKVTDFMTIREKTRYLNDYYCLLIRVYAGRLKHRNYGFVPNLFDSGHQEQFEIVLNKITSVEIELAKMYAQLTEENNAVHKPHCDKITVNVKRENAVIEKMKKFKQKRLDDSKLVDAALRTYINENRKHQRTIQKMINVCLNTLQGLCKGSQNYRKQFGLYRLIGELHNIGYFEANFKPSNCMNFDLHEIHLLCGCVEHFNNMQDFLANTHPESLATFHKVLQHDRLAIKKICADFNQLYDEFDDDMFEIPLLLIWDNQSQRLILTINEEEYDDD